MAIEIIKMSSKGQVVIPQHVRKELKVDEGSLFAVLGTKDSVVLKKIETPSKEKLLHALTIIAKEGKERLQKKGIKESDIPLLIQKSRKP